MKDLRRGPSPCNKAGEPSCFGGLRRNRRYTYPDGLPLRLREATKQEVRSRRSPMNPPVNAPAIKIVKSVREQVSAEEWQARVDLAACYRRTAMYGMTEMIANHISS